MPTSITEAYKKIERKIYKAHQIIDDNPNVEDLTDMTDEEFDRLIRSHNVLGQKLREAAQKSHQGTKLPSIGYTPTGRLPKLFVHTHGDQDLVNLPYLARCILGKVNKIGSGYHPISYEEAMRIDSLTPRAREIWYRYNRIGKHYNPIQCETATDISKEWWRPLNWYFWWKKVPN